jgi:hypothetical protein
MLCEKLLPMVLEAVKQDFRKNTVFNIVLWLGSKSAGIKILQLKNVFKENMRCV